MKQQISIFCLLLSPLLACSNEESAKIAKHQTHIGSETCVESTTTDVDECNETFCSPEKIKILINDPGDLLDCERETEDYRAFVYQSESVNLRLSFDPTVATDHSANSLTQGFTFFSVDVFVPQDHVDKRFRDLDFIVLREASDFETLSFADGRVQAKANFDLDTIYYNLESNDPNCFSDDIAGSCVCSYDADIKVELEIDMALSDIDTCMQGF